MGDSRLQIVVVVWIVIVTFWFGVWVGRPTVPPMPSKTEYRAPVPAPAVRKMGDSEVVYDGHIRSIDWVGRSFIYESAYGFVKVIGPVCGHKMLPVWQGMHVYEINFHWYQPTDRDGCFDLDYVGHAAGVPGE